MNSEGFVTFVAAGLAFIASIIATGVSVYNARFNRFAKQTWWERKVDAYNKIIEALSTLVYYYEARYDAEISGRDIPDARRQEINKFWRDSYAELKKATSMGTFLISTDANNVLKRIWSEKGKRLHPNDWFSQLESDYITARDCLKELVSAAKNDLRVR